ncbi:hypothetical protein [Ruminococcus sp.]|uniref:hypothetical protein n=1 Tax=Ruminococcus sp. TaxID=41978 RepID=UPI002E802294|nr:hypothetical protein [Ruminococcus sp.]MEE3438825.1 hypothetical protein [Ruminococcus sp.]
MYIPNPYFENIPKMGNLIMDYIFLENDYPVLFTCKNQVNDNLYLCVCRTVIEKQKWIISEISIDTLEKFINDEITVHDAFKVDNKLSCIATWCKEKPKEEYNVIKSSTLLDKDLPNSDVFLEDDDPDTLDYLEMVKNRNRIELNTSIQFKNVDEQSVLDCSYSVSSHDFVDTFKTNSMSLYSTTENVSTKVIYKSESDNIYISKEKCDYKMSKENYSCSDISHAA